MKAKYCPRCGAPMKKKDDFCPNCGLRVPRQKGGGGGVLIALLVILLLAAAAGIGTVAFLRQRGRRLIEEKISLWRSGDINDLAGYQPPFADDADYQDTLRAIQEEFGDLQEKAEKEARAAATGTEAAAGTAAAGTEAAAGSENTASAPGIPAGTSASAEVWQISDPLLPLILEHTEIEIKTPLLIRFPLTTEMRITGPDMADLITDLDYEKYESGIALRKDIDEALEDEDYDLRTVTIPVTLRKEHGGSGNGSKSSKSGRNGKSDEDEENSKPGNSANSAGEYLIADPSEEAVLAFYGGMIELHAEIYEKHLEELSRLMLQKGGQ